MTKPPPLVSAGLLRRDPRPLQPLPPSGAHRPGGPGGPGRPGLRPASALTRDSLEGSSYVPAPTRRASAGAAATGAAPLKSSNGKSSRPAPDAPDAPDAPAPRPPRPGQCEPSGRRRYSHLGVVVPEDYQEGEPSAGRGLREGAAARH